MPIEISESTQVLVNLADYNQKDLVITLQPGVHFLCVYDATDDANITFHLEKDAVLHFVLLITGGTHTKIDLKIFLEGQHAQANVRGLYALQGTQQATVTTVQHHKAPSTKSDLVIKGLLAGSAKSWYQGTILVDQSAKYTNALQENKNMLLTPFAQAHSMPSLEVLTHDVVCKHGSAVGYLDEQLFFYAQSRGLAQEDAQQLLIRGFFAQIVATLPRDMVFTIYKKLDAIGVVDEKKYP